MTDYRSLTAVLLVCFDVLVVAVAKAPLFYFISGISVFIYGPTNSFYQSRILHQTFAFLQSAGNLKFF